MTPVRVVTPGGPPVLPLRMVAAGVGAKVQMTLFVFANTPMQIPDLMDARIEAEEITWDHWKDESEAFDIAVVDRNPRCLLGHSLPPRHDGELMKRSRNSARA